MATNSHGDRQLGSMATLWPATRRRRPIVVARRSIVLASVVAFVVFAMIGAWLFGSHIESPADVAARTAPPTPSPILVPVERRVLSSSVVTRGTARHGLPQPVAIAPSNVKSATGLITTLPRRNARIAEGGVILTASGRPVFVLQGEIPAYRDLTPGIAGDDVGQLEQGLSRLGFEPGRIDGVYDVETSAAVTEWYSSAGWEPFGSTKAQLAELRALEAELGEAKKLELASAAAAASATLVVESARASAALDYRKAAAELAAKTADQSRLLAASATDAPLAVEAERAKAAHAVMAARAEVAAKVAERALVVLDPRQPKTARAAADAKLELARAAARRTHLESELAIQAAEREARLAAQRLELAKAAVEAAELGGRRSIQAARDSEAVAKLEAKLAATRVARIAEQVRLLRSRLGVQVPVDEIVFLPSLPVRVEELTAVVGDAAKGPVMSVTDYQLAVDSALPLDVAPLVEPGVPVRIDEQALGIKASGVVSHVASGPGTRGVDGYHVYFEVRVTETRSPIAGFSVRLTIPVQSTEGAVTVVPLSAVSLTADGTSRVQVQTEGGVADVVVEPGLSADGFVEVTPVDGSLEPGQLVVVGYERPQT